ncbi:hypothetical protein FPV58_04730 [Mycolicibacterium porcinum]|uniref:hypothetical protein n=1 Tax=Mycolicibacterium porcinum TaxID=39693 RepID=UPI00118FB67C|nr:hypothetical protein [Mycolicibacterium porcinum]TVY04772.1 hypothetical protein FPV58_04730 [Mycolicibacterium porcinum]
MNLALRPYATAGIALVGAGVIAAAPLAPPPVAIDSAMARTSSAAVELTAAVDPIAAWAGLFAHIPESILALGNLIAENPAPLLGQIVANWSGYGQTLGTALQTAGTGLSNYLTTQLPTALQTFSNQLMSGDTEGAAQTFHGAILSLAFGVGFPMLNVLSIPADITQNLANAVATLPGFAGPVISVGLGALMTVNGTTLATGASAQAVVDAFKSGDPFGVVNALAAMPATIADALLNGYASPDGGLYPGLLTVSHPRSPDAEPWDPSWPDGLAAALVKSRLAIAKALGWEDPATAGTLSEVFGTGSKTTALPSAASVPDAAAATPITLSADPSSIEPKAEADPTTDVDSAPAGSAPTETSGSTPTKEETVPHVRKSLIATPGKADSLGVASKPAAKVASDVRDGISATVNKIGEGVKKAFAKPGKADKASKSDAGPGTSDTK